MVFNSTIYLCGFLACLAALLAVGMARQGVRCWRSFAGRRGAFAAVAFLCAVCMIQAQKRGTVSFDGDFIRDAGSYATNDVLHVAATNAPASAMMDLTSSPLLVYRRPCDSTNAADWVELMPRRTFGELPADWTSVNATNYNYLVYLDYVPPSPVHTNGVWQMRGFEVPGMANAYAFPNTRQEDVVIVPVEYLESTGTQWIDTGIHPSETLSFEATFLNNGNDAPGYGNVFGSRIKSLEDEYQLTQYTYGSIGIGVRNTGLMFYGGTINVVAFDGGSTATINGVAKTISTKAFSTDPGTIVMFGIRQNGTIVQLQSGRIYRCRFGKVRDFIPVRVGQVGYMYDRVSGRLFGNAGKGAFIIGPDLDP